MTKRTYFIALSIAALSLVFLGAGCQKEEGVEGARTEISESSSEAAKAGVTQEELDAIVKTAERFAERFGTYTNEENYQNFLNLKIYATPSMQAWMDNFVKEQQASFEERDLVFFGITTSALVSKVIDARPGYVEILINTKREELTDQSEAADISYQNILIKMEEVDDDWKVDFAEFQGT